HLASQQLTANSTGKPADERLAKQALRLVSDIATVQALLDPISQVLINARQRVGKPAPRWFVKGDGSAYGATLRCAWTIPGLPTGSSCCGASRRCTLPNA